MRTFILIFAFAVVGNSAWANDEKSIVGLRNALLTLSPSVDPAEAELMSVTAHTTSRRLAQEYRVVGPPAFQNFLIHVGVRQRGFCFDWAHDIGARLKELKLKTLVLHWGASFAGTEWENNCLVVTARGQPFQDGIVIDGWRKAGRLWWSGVSKDVQNIWKEDMGETTWLQDYQSNKRKPIGTNRSVSRADAGNNPSNSPEAPRLQ
jgi:hypothetical protein